MEREEQCVSVGAAPGLLGFPRQTHLGVDGELDLVPLAQSVRDVHL